ncbi:hypothetical protein ACQKNS_03405 [Peribacillus sp. NPDC094092]|uniref:hypothetical protein n=1 Tax=Peribacillus sp. NPDC094092 TaxID=3390611 RepID=UPI003D00ECD0
MEVKHKYEFTVNGMEITLKDKSHAGIFRQFWAYFMNLDMDKTIKTIESVGIRTSDSESEKWKQEEKYPRQGRILDIHALKSPSNAKNL